MARLAPFRPRYRVSFRLCLRVCRLIMPCQSRWGQLQTLRGPPAHSWTKCRSCVPLLLVVVKNHCAAHLMMRLFAICRMFRLRLCRRVRGRLGLAPTPKSCPSRVSKSSCQSSSEDPNTSWNNDLPNSDDGAYRKVNDAKRGNVSSNCNACDTVLSSMNCPAEIIQPPPGNFYTTFRSAILTHPGLFLDVDSYERFMTTQNLAT